MSKQSSMHVFSTDCYNRGFLFARGTRLEQAGWVPEGQTQLSFCYGYAWELLRADCSAGLQEQEP